MDYLIVDSKANLTDFIYTGHIKSTSFVISPKVLSILANLSVQENEIFDIKVSYKNQNYDYKFIHFTKDYSKIIDFEKSIFVIKEVENLNEYGEDSIPLELKSYNDLIDAFRNREVLTNIIPERLVFKESLNQDIIAIQYLYNVYTCICSERLMEEFDKNNITGHYFYKPVYPISIGK